MTKKPLIELFQERLDEVGPQFKEFPWTDKQAYASWLAQTYFFVKHTTIFIALTGARLGFENRELHYGVLDHFQGEKNHDLVALNDLKALGHSIDEFEEFLETSAFYQTQYYFIDHVHPIAHLGFATFLEGLAAQFGEEIADKLEGAFGKKANRFIAIHAVEDQDHFEKGCQQLEKVSGKARPFIIQNLNQTADLYQKILTKAQAHNTVIPLKKVA